MRNSARRKHPGSTSGAEDRIAQLEAENQRLKTVLGDMALDLLLSPSWIGSPMPTPPVRPQPGPRPRR